ncbi:MAG: DNA polymerase III subunit beta [Gammaproteobacteria bacterium SG8_15]|nr:MAG: DNA polymerase III subunit beta [Gammaproteobacteria bacterium SG8_15]
MNKIILDKQPQLIELCKQFHAQRLEVFGSVTRDDFDPEKSDLDFLVVFEEMAPGEHADSYFGLLSELEALFDRNIDLVELKAITNPYFLEAVEESRVNLYAA